MTEAKTDLSPHDEARMMMRLVSTALNKIDTGGVRGLSMVTYSEIDAMASMLIIQAAELQTMKSKLEGLTQ